MFSKQIWNSGKVTYDMIQMTAKLEDVCKIQAVLLEAFARKTINVAWSISLVTYHGLEV